ncbi:MAG TPA: phosphoribosylglycinamide formyltransferase [Paludibacteraceae bacterium]|nr:phosphoribosylglycinamide formyltransferase [Paludibacteraceae bacterium]HPH62582.1 phosphoribosylglycinamide formyltransferase [Paludibacteraceae bacterium]HQF49438.1 phosphoribosylglycinamide formyltransferase [Paludibacteraceae bacterium]HQJ90143.1 phosphoribosylglycinamide formyltransferase [Paludibacteraceae bacterium]
MSKKIAIFASGSGTNAENIIKYFSSNKKAEVKLLLCNKKDAYVLERAKNFGIPSVVFTKKEMEEGYVLSFMKENDIDFIVLAGFLLKVSDDLIKNYPNRIVNIHPALLPKYGGKGMYGMKVHESVVAAGEKESGITIHYVNEFYDSGAIIFQKRCSVLPTDTPEDVATKVHALEYECFPKVIDEVLEKL